MNAMEILSVSLSAAAFLGAVTYHVSVYRELRESRRETSRFPLFAARDRLVALVACGAMSEDDPAWRNLYSGANTLLGMHQELHALDCFWRYLKSSVKVETDPHLRARRDEMRKIEDNAASKNPEFAAARDEMIAAFGHLVSRRTNIWHRTGIVLLVGGLYLLVAFATAGLSGAHAAVQAIRRFSGRASSDDLRLWGGGIGPRAAA